MLATSDSDWYQALGEKVIWFSPHAEKQVTLGDLRGSTAVREGPFDSTDHYIQAKALAGDSLDGMAANGHYQYVWQPINSIVIDNSWL